MWAEKRIKHIKTDPYGMSMSSNSLIQKQRPSMRSLPVD